MAILTFVQSTGKIKKEKQYELLIFLVRKKINYRGIAKSLIAHTNSHVNYEINIEQNVQNTKDNCKTKKMIIGYLYEMVIVLMMLIERNANLLINENIAQCRSAWFTRSVTKKILMPITTKHNNMQTTLLTSPLTNSPMMATLDVNAIVGIAANGS